MGVSYSMEADIAIIGAGASGLLAAIAAARRGASVLLLEKMPRPARKIMITGKGRCNFSNFKPWNDFSAHIRSGASFLRPAFYSFPPEKVSELLEAEGVQTVIERGDRAYPVSHRASDVVDALQRAAKRSGARLLTGVSVLSAAASGDSFSLETSSGQVLCRRLIIATGGISYPGTGSTGDGYSIARSFGHSIRPLLPSLTALVPKGYKLPSAPQGDYFPVKGHIERSSALSELGAMLEGLSLRNIGVSLESDGRLLREEFGDIDFTDGGIEGPVGFTLSRDCVKIIAGGGHASIVLDLKPAAAREELLSRIKALWTEISRDPRSRSASPRQLLTVMVGKLLPREAVRPFIRMNPGLLSGRSGSEHLNFEALTVSLKAWTFEIAGFVGWERCVVTAGGVELSEVLPKTMESRLRKGLYLCGELLDIDSDTGGYNLQTAFSTGHLAGESAAKALSF